jgi:hypothetical protein
MRWLILTALLVGCQTTKERTVYFTCPTPDLYDFQAGKKPWIKQDVLAFERAKVACPEKNFHMPCLIRFVRYDHGDYGAICGAKREVYIWK